MIFKSDVDMLKTLPQSLLYIGMISLTEPKRKFTSVSAMVTCQNKMFWLDDFQVRRGHAKNTP